MRLLLGLLLSTTALASGSPSALVDAHFVPAAEPKARASLTFVAPGVVDVREGEQTTRCRFESEGSGYLWTLRVLCGEEAQRHHWTWLPGGRVSTDLLASREALMRVALPEKPLATLDARAPEPKRRAASEDETLAGRWEGWDATAFEVRADGAVESEGKRLFAKLGLCVNEQLPEIRRVPCLRLRMAAGQELSLGLLAPNVLVEGRMSNATEGELRFEGFRGGRAFRR